MSKQLDAIVADLYDTRSLKVWSLIITFFGDSIVNRGGNVSANTVHTVLGRADIGSGAVRTAFSRLVSDGWVSREKRGRRSYYQLTTAGVSPFVQATKRIYSPTDSVSVADSNWLLGLHQEKEALSNLSISNAILLPNRAVLVADPDACAQSVLEEQGFLTINGNCGKIPEWVVQHLIPADTSDQFDGLRNTFKKISTRPPADPLSALVARTLLIHQWRRLLLRYPSLPDQLKGDTLMAESECRKFVGQLYQRLTDSAEQWLSEHGSCIDGALSSPLANPDDRFTQRYLKKSIS